MIKHISVLILLPFVVMFYSCNNNVAPANYEAAGQFQVDLQSRFQNTPVIVSIDNRVIFNDIVTTNLSLSLAAAIPFEIVKGTHVLTVTVGNSITRSTLFTISDALYIGVNYNSNASEITFIAQTEPFPYR